jgi:PAS domain S-box-containing protein
MEPERNVEQKFISLQPGDHLCCIYSDEQEREEVLKRFLEDGLRQGQKLIYIYEGFENQSVQQFLQRLNQVFVEALLRGQLLVYLDNEIYFHGKQFDAQWMNQLLGLEVEKALAEGYPSLRLIGEMNWAAGEVSTLIDVVEYEASLNHALFSDRVVILCSYHRHRFKPDLLLDLLATHPKVVVGASVYKNFYYVPPDVFLQNDRASARFDLWISNLKSRHQTESELEQARSDLSRQVEEQINRLAEVNQHLYSEIRQRMGTEYALLQTSNALSVSENQFRSLLQSTPVGIMMTDEKGIVVEWNSCAQEIYQAPAERVLGRPIWEVLAEYLPIEHQNEESYQQLRESLQIFFKTGYAPWLYEYENRNLVWPDGELRYIQRVRFPIRTERGYMLGSIMRDVTDQRRVELELGRYRQHLETMVEQRTFELKHEIGERQQVEEVLRESEGRYRALVNQAPFYIMVAQDGHYVFVNPAVVQRLGYSSAYELIGRKAGDIVADESRETFAKRQDRILGGEASEPVIIAFQCKDGSVYYSECTSVPIFYQGRPAVLIIGQDVTERLRYEQQLKSSLAEKEVMLREIHHRVKNNLNVIIALIDLQKAAQSEPQILQIFKELQSRIYTMALVHDSVYRSPNLAKIDLAGYLQTLVSYLHSAYEPYKGDRGSSNIQFEVKVEDVSMKVETAIPCGLIVNELVTNALKHAFPTGYTCLDPQSCQIKVKLAPISDTTNQMIDIADAGFTLTVSDNGVGLPAGYNWRSASTLGMQLVQVLSRQLGGQMELFAVNGVTWKLSFVDRR